MAKFSRLVVPCRNGEFVVEKDGTIRFPDNCRVEQPDPFTLLFFPRESSDAAGDVAPKGGR